MRAGRGGAATADGAQGEGLATFTYRYVEERCAGSTATPANQRARAGPRSGAARGDAMAMASAAAIASEVTGHVRGECCGGRGCGHGR